MGRKNGKTALIAALVLAHLVGPEAIPNGEIYSAANDREQAAQVYKMASQMVRADPELSEMLKCVDSTKTIAFFGNGSFYKALSAEAGTKHGLNPALVIFDELAQARDRELYDVLDTAMGGREEPLFVTISTQSNDPEHILSKLIDDGLSGVDPTIVCHLYAVDDEADPFDSRQWKKANPALGDFRDLADFKALAAKAARMPAEEPKFRNLYLNQRVAPVSSLLSRREWAACQGEAEFTDGEAVYLGLDLSSVNDLTSLVMVSAAAPVKVKPFFWKPEAWLGEHSHRDFGAGNARYEEWHKAGHLGISPGKTIDHLVVAKQVAELVGRYDVRGLAYDRWRINDFLRVLDQVGLAAQEDEGDGLRLVPWGQGFRDMAPAIDALEQVVIERQIIHPGNPVLTWNVGNAVAVTDAAGNRKLDKDKARFRIDGAVAMAMAVGLRARDVKTSPAFDVAAMVG
jgi:phage terminase large subunit-like protein